MKKLLLALIICISTSVVANAQTPPLNKNQTVKYIENLFKSSWSSSKTNIVSVSVDEKIFVVKSRSGKTFRNDLSKVNILKIGKSEENLFYISETDFEGSILWNLQLESDALRLKKALEHLIELLKAEKSTDPFNN